jgi:hypothetical protein
MSAPGTATPNRKRGRTANVVALNALGVASVQKKSKWLVPSSAAKTVDDLSFTSRDAAGRVCWWDVTPPKTEYWHAHVVLGRAYAFELLDMIHNPDADVPPGIVGYIAQDIFRWSRAQRWGADGVPHGFFEALSEFMVTGTTNR